MERRLPVSGGESGLACHPERSEGSGWPHAAILRGVYPERSECAQDDTSSLQISISRLAFFTRIVDGAVDKKIPAYLAA